MNLVLQHLEQQTKFRLILFVILLVLVIGFIDYVTGTEFALSIFYLIPISLAVWFISATAGVIMSILCAIVWLAAEVPWRGDVFSLPAVEVWNAFVRLGIFLIVNELTAALKAYQKQQAEFHEHLKIEEAVRKNEERYRGLVENMSEGYHVTDAHGLFVFCSPNIEAHFCVSPGGLIGRSALSLIDRADRGRVAHIYETAAREGRRDLLCEFHIGGGRGEARCIEQSSRIIRDVRGAVVEFRSITRDITQRKKTDNQVRLLAQALESTAEMVSITDLESRFVFINKSFKEHYGYSEAEILGNPPSMLQPARLGGSLSREIFLHTRMGGWSGELVNVKKSGEEFPILLSTSRIQDDTGTVLGLIGVARDISDQKRAEEALRAAQERFEHLFTERGAAAAAGTLQTGEEPFRARIHDLATRINDVTEKMRHQMRQTLSLSTLASHELRTPLMVIRHQLEEVLNVDATMDNIRKTLISVYDDTLRLSRTIEQFLTIGTLQSGTIKLAFTDVDMRDLLQKFYDEALLLARPKEVSIVLSHTPPATCVRGDADQLRQLLFNLFDNALKHTPNGGHIRIGTELAESSVRLRFSDTGKGIRPEDLSRIFEPFFKANTETSNSHGVGLGLAHVRWIVEAHKGTISVESEQGKGTMFIIELPRIVPAAVPGPLPLLSQAS